MKIYDRRPIMTDLADKYKVRDYVKQKLDSSFLIPLLWAGDNPDDIPFDALPESFVIKTNHASGTNIIVKDKNNINKEEIIKKLRKWLKTNYYYPKREWAYKNIERKVIVEKFISEDGKVPEDYKVFIFNGKAALIEVDHDREVKHNRSLYDLNWNKLDHTLEHPMSDKVLEKPRQMDELIKYAEILGSDFRQARIDFYIVKDHIYFGEITFYHGAGFERFIPDDEKWNEYYGRMIDLG
ncbi:MAG: ATP-grasp fold amidoligase family protein [Caldicoprobacterales bacterium]